MRSCFVSIVVWLLFTAVAPMAAETRPWRDYQVIMWTGDSAAQAPEKLPLFYQRLKEMGVTAGMVHNDASPATLLSNRFPYYVENMVNRGLCLKWNSQVKDWDKFVTEWARTGRPESALVREYSFDDPKWQAYATGEMQRMVRRHAPHQPLAYDIRDELSVTISANPFDYDFHPLALAGFRSWLKTQYTDLAALNVQWETQFTSWDDVKPFTTDQIKNRMASGKALPPGKPDWGQVAATRFVPEAARREPTRWNFSPWSDHRTYMDVSLARALNELRRVAREIDPRTPVGIEGTQMPHAFGGYDLWRLSQSLDWVEPYDIGSARSIFGSFMPGKTMFTTVFEKDTPAASRRLWHLLLEGDRGCIIWWSEDCIDWKSPNYQLTAKARALKPILTELGSPLARLFLRAQRVHDPVYVHYSQPSVRVNWLIESTVDGSTWLRRFSSFEAQHNRQAQVRESWLKAFQDLGLSPRFISTEQIESGVLRGAGPSVLVLPTSWALTDKEGEEILRFTKEGSGELFFDGTPGVFDGHGRLRPQSRLEEFWTDSLSATGCVQVARGKANRLPSEVTAYATDRLKSTNAPPFVPVLTAEIQVPGGARVRVHRFTSRGARLLAMERNISYHMSEDLKQAGGNEALEKPVEFEARLARAAHVYELSTGRYVGFLDRIPCRVDPWHPALYALTNERVAEQGIVEQLTEAE